MPRPLVSIVVPIYNVEAYLQRCLDSIAAQDYRPIEVILINDGSPDRCEEIIRRYEARWPFIRSFHQKNQGVGAARNTGIELARGTYLAFIDSDDYIEPDYISCLVQVAEKNDADVAVCNFFIHIPGMKTFSFPFMTSRKLLTGEDAARLSLKLPAIPTFAWNKLYRRSLFTDPEVRFPSIHYEDLATMSRILVHAEKVAITRKPLYHYCIRGSGITGNYKQKNIEDYLEAVRMIRQFIMVEGREQEWDGTFRYFLLAVETQILFEILLKMRSIPMVQRRRMMLQTHRKLRRFCVRQSA